jgi:hypothetical protein
MNVKCPIYGREKELKTGEIFRDRLEVFTVCRCCDAQYDINYDRIDKNYIEITQKNITAKYVVQLVS